jgi:rhomboid protease GluP
MIFLRYESLGQYLRLYPVTSFILAVNLVLFILMEGMGSSTDSGTLLQFGAVFGHPDEQPAVWRYVSAAFLHIGFKHLLFNCFAIYVFAPPLERLLGAWRYAVFYLAAAVAGNIVSHLMHDAPYLSAGASGAIYGLYGAYLQLAVFRRELFDRDAKKTVMSLLAVGVIYSFISPSIDIYAHLGGFVGGFLILFMLNKRTPRASDVKMEPVP